MITDEEARELAKKLIVVRDALREYCWSRDGCYGCPIDNEVCALVNCDEND